MCFISWLLSYSTVNLIPRMMKKYFLYNTELKTPVL